MDVFNNLSDRRYSFLLHRFEGITNNCSTFTWQHITKGTNTEPLNTTRNKVNFHVV
jgi:hypothetical protein